MVIEEEEELDKNDESNNCIQIKDRQQLGDQIGVTVVPCRFEFFHKGAIRGLGSGLAEFSRVRTRQGLGAFLDRAALRCEGQCRQQDSRTRRNAAIARIVRGALEGMDLKWKDPGLKPESFDFG